MTEILSVDNLSKSFGGFAALDQVTLAVDQGERVGLIGPNGSGKSTFVNCITGTIQNAAGTVYFSGHDLRGLSAHERSRRGIARTFQLPRPFSSMSVEDNVRVPLLYSVGARRGSRMDDAAIRQRTEEVLGMVGLSAKKRTSPLELTQIEMRKLELARAVATEPALLIADEVMAGLSHSEVEEIVDLLLHLNEERGITIILIEHIMSAVMRFSQRLVVFVSGRKIADGPPDAVIRNPEVERAYLG